MNTVYRTIFKVLNFRDSCACRENWFCESVATPLYVSTWVIRVNYFPQKFNFGKMRKFSTSKITRYVDKYGQQKLWLLLFWLTFAQNLFFLLL